MAAGVAVELVHLATLMHDDLIDGARLRRGHASAWSAHGPEAARAAGDYLFARAFAEIAATGDAHAVAVLANATLCLARGEALQRSQRFDPDTSIAAYLERCTLKTGKLFEAACRLAGGSGAFGLALGVAFQISDDILDCSGVTIETGKIAGTDLREGTPTLPLLLAAQRDEEVRAALAGEAQLEGALLRVASTGAIEESREVALAYARNARACLNGELHREELESLTYAVVEQGALMALLERTDMLAPIRDKVEAGERLDFEDGVTLMESDDILALGELADLGATRSWRRRPRLLRPEPLLEPDERLPREVQVLRVRRHAASSPTPTRIRRKSWSRTPFASTSSPASRRSTWSAARARTWTSTTTSGSSARCTRRFPTCTSSSSPRARSTT